MSDSFSDIFITHGLPNPITREIAETLSAAKTQRIREGAIDGSVDPRAGAAGMNGPNGRRVKADTILERDLRVCPRGSRSWAGAGTDVCGGVCGGGRAVTNTVGTNMLVSASTSMTAAEEEEEGSAKKRSKLGQGKLELKSQWLKIPDLLPKGGLDACARGDLATLKTLVESGEWDPRYFVCKEESTPLMWAASGGHVHVIKWLVSTYGASLNDQNRVGRTAIMFACKVP